MEDSSDHVIIVLDPNNVNDVSQTININNKHNIFQWLEKAHQCFPMLVTPQNFTFKNGCIMIIKNNGIDKQSLIYASFVLISLFVNIGLLFGWGVESFTHTFKNSYTTELNPRKNVMYPIIFNFAFLLKVIANLILVFKYFPNEFGPVYPWRKDSIINAITNAENADNTDNTDNAGLTKSSSTIGIININYVRIDKTNKRLKFWVWFSLIVFICQLTRNIIELMIGIDDKIEDCIGFILDIYFIEAPSIFGQLILTIIFLNVKLEMDNLTAAVNSIANCVSNNYNYSDLTIKYKNIYTQFNKDYQTLYLFASCKIFSILLWLWITLTNYKITFHYTSNDDDEKIFLFGILSGVLWTCWNFIILIEFIIAGDAVTKSYYQFKDKIFLDSDNNNDSCSANYLRNFVSNYTTTAKFVKDSDVSIQNTRVFFTVFIVTLFATYQILV